MAQSTQHFLDEPPAGQSLTVYDQEHMALYLRLLDAERDGADWRDVVRVLFDLDPEADPELVEELYNTFRSVNPEFVRDPSRLRMALREAIQYEAVPTHTLSELAQIRKTMGESRDREQKAEDKEYDTGLGNKKD